jgi:hypothetical protein
MFDGACAVQANGRRDLIASKYAAIIALRLSHIAEWDECGHHGVAGTGLCIIIINPCKPYLKASAPRLTHWGGGKKTDHPLYFGVR